MAPHINFALYKTTNPDESITIADAEKVQAVLVELGLGFDAIYAASEAQSGPENEIELSIFKAAVPPPVPYFLVGRYTKDKDMKAYNIALDRAFFFIPQEVGAPNRQDPQVAYFELYADRNPGTTQDQAKAALLSTQVAQAAISHAVAQVVQQIPAPPQ